MRLKDAYLVHLPVGIIVFPSSAARKDRRGGGYGDLITQESLKDHEIFPALIISADRWNKSIKVLSPTGVHILSQYCCVSVEVSS